MKTGKMLSAFVALALAFVGSASATTIAQFDLGQSNSEGWGLITTSSLSASNGGVTLTAAGPGLSSRTRGGVATDVAEDFIFNNQTITFTFTDLLSNQEYDFLTYAYDNTGGGSETGNWYVSTIDASPEHVWVNSSDSIDPFTLNGTSDVSGELTIFVVGQGSNNRANGFEVVLVPEPSALALLSLVGLTAIFRRRRT